MTAEAIRDALHRRYRPTEIGVSPVTSVIANHAGPDAWGVFYQVEDEIPPRPGNNPGARAL